MLFHFLQVLGVNQACGQSARCTAGRKTCLVASANKRQQPQHVCAIMTYCQSYIEILLCATCVRVKFTSSIFVRTKSSWTIRCSLHEVATLCTWSTGQNTATWQANDDKPGWQHCASSKCWKAHTSKYFPLVCLSFVLCLHLHIIFLLRMNKIKSTDILILWINFSKQEIQFILCLALLYPQLQSIIWLIPPVLN